MPVRWGRARPEIKRRRGVAVAAALCALVAACAPGRAFDTARALAGLAGGPEADEAAVTRRSIAYRIEGRARSGDLYEPAEGQGAALVLVPGVAPAGKDDPRLVAFARTLARARFTVLVPDIAGLRELRVGAGDIRAAADAMRYLARDGTARTVAICGISYAAGPALLAALEPEVRPHVRFVLAIGGYHSMEALLTYVTTGAYRPAAGEAWRFGEPNPYGRWAFLKANAHRVTGARDRALLIAIAERRIRDGAAPVDDLVARLDADGAAVWALMANRDPDRVPALIEALPAALREQMRALDPSRRDLAGRAPTLVLVHGRDDRIIPYTESAALAAAAGADAHVYLVDSLAHVDLALGGIGDAITVWRAIYRLLSERDEMVAGTR